MEQHYPPYGRGMARDGGAVHAAPAWPRWR